jgi:hypothetical protein
MIEGRVVEDEIEVGLGSATRNRVAPHSKRGGDRPIPPGIPPRARSCTRLREVIERVAKDLYDVFVRHKHLAHRDYPPY